jgi:hypothetical protein
MQITAATSPSPRRRRFDDPYGERDARRDDPYASGGDRGRDSGSRRYDDAPRRFEESSYRH